MNTIQLTGNLVKDPELQKTPNGRNVCQTSLAVKRPYKSETDTDYFLIQLWNNQAEYLCTYGKKGTKIGVTGCAINNTYTDKKGEKRSSTVFVCDKVEILSNGNSENDKAEKTGIKGITKLSDLQQVDSSELPF